MSCDSGRGSDPCSCEDTWALHVGFDLSGTFE